MPVGYTAVHNGPVVPAYKELRKQPFLQHQSALCLHKGLRCAKTCCKTESYGNGFVHKDTQETEPVLASRGRYALDARVVRHVDPIMD